jgi:hypothetical protein
MAATIAQSPAGLIARDAAARDPVQGEHPLTLIQLRF